MLSSGFDYNQTKLKGASIETKKRFEKPHRIGSFKASSKIQIHLPQIPNSFADLKNAYLKFNINGIFEPVGDPKQIGFVPNKLLSAP